MQKTNYHAGLCAEGIAERYYHRAGLRTRKRRWRGRSGEVDLILQQGDELVFVEVKKSRSFERAAQRLSRRQIQRIMTAAEEFIGAEPNGLNSEMRFDVALVNDAGQIQVIENALMAG